MATTRKSLVERVRSPCGMSLPGSSIVSIRSSHLKSFECHQGTVWRLSEEIGLDSTVFESTISTGSVSFGPTLAQTKSRSWITTESQARNADGSYSNSSKAHPSWGDAPGGVSQANGCYATGAGGGNPCPLPEDQRACERAERHDAQHGPSSGQIFRRIRGFLGESTASLGSVPCAAQRSEAVGQNPSVFIGRGRDGVAHRAVCGGANTRGRLFGHDQGRPR